MRTAGRQEVSDLLIAAEPTPPGSRALPARSARGHRDGVVPALGGRPEQRAAREHGGDSAGGGIDSRARRSRRSSCRWRVREGSLRTFGGMVRLGLLPPGQYVARAVVTAPGQAETRVLRSFRYAPSLLAARAQGPDRRAAAASVDEEVLPPPPPRIAVRLPRFNPSHGARARGRGRVSRVARGACIRLRREAAGGAGQGARRAASRRRSRRTACPRPTKPPSRSCAG